MMVVALNTSVTHMWSTNSDFAINEGVFGFDYRQSYAARRLAGNFGRLKRPSEIMLFCDAVPAGTVDALFVSMFPYPWITMTPAPTGPSAVTLADVLANNANVVPNRAQFDKPRHKGRVNIAFADGHVETVAITPGDLERVHLTTR